MGSADYRTHQQRLPLSRFTAWALERYCAVGRRLHTLEDVEAPDWNFNVGCFNLVPRVAFESVESEDALENLDITGI
eukprot:5098548-Lingulodinium_polyedra.AAC.1